MKAIIGLTNEMIEDRKSCGEDSDCYECKCQIGKDDCVYNYIADKLTAQKLVDELSQNKF